MRGRPAGKFRVVALALLMAAAASGLYLVFGRADAGAHVALVSPTGKWTCSMCPQFILPEPGKCPKCFMDLIPLQEGAGVGGRLELFLKPEAADLAGIATEMVGEADGVAVVPASALLRNLGRSFVFVESMEEDSLVFTLREVGVGRRLGGAFEALSGLDAGDMVVSKGAFRIDSAMQIMGKVSLANLPPGELTSEDVVEPFMPAERSGVDLRASGADVDSWFDAYEAVRAALARDDVGTAGNAARRLRDSLVSGGFANGGAGFPELYEKLSVDAGGLAGAKSLDAVRAAFERVSGDMVLLARRYGAPAGGLRVIFCPMAFGGVGAHWLQPRETVDNPYHGLEMPLCGWQVDSIAE